MKLLAIDTSTTACSVALLMDDLMHVSHEVAPMQQAKLILPTIHKLLEKSHITLNELDALAFGRGPGSFTGVRIATSVMQGLALVTGLPLITVSSLAAVAQGSYQDKGFKKNLVVMDARMQEVYWAAYEVDAEGLVQLVGQEQVTLPQAIQKPAGEDWAAVGTGWEVYRDRIPFQLHPVDSERLPEASAIALLAKEKFLKQEFLKPEEALPVYLRDNVAKKRKV